MQVRQNKFNHGDNRMNRITKMYFEMLFAPSKKQKVITVFITIGFIIFFLTLIYKIAILENRVSDMEKLEIKVDKIKKILNKLSGENEI
jgi:hypothetical protein